VKFEELAHTKLEEFEYHVEKGKIREFARAICDPNPVYTDSEYARSRGFEDIIVPPTFPMTTLFYMTSENVFLESMQNWGMDPAKSVHGEVEFVFERPVCAGEAFRGVAGTRNVYEKPGKRGGMMTFIEQEIKLIDTSGKLVVTVLNTFIEKE